jgi:signal transduction histidine kinase
MESRSRLLLVCSLGGLLLLIVLTGVAALAIMTRIQAGEAALRNRDAGRTLERIRGDIYLSGTLARDYFSEPAEALADRLTRLETQSKEALEPYPELRSEAIAYWRVLDLMREMALRPRTPKVEAYFRLQLASRREAMLHLSDEIGVAMVAERKIREAELTGMYGQFRGMMLAELLLVVMAGSAISVKAFRKLTRLEGETRALSARLVESQEQERRSIARELHDEVGQSLTALLLDLGAAASELEGAARARVQSIATAAERIVEEVRRIALSLRPSMLDDLGLVSALEWQAREVGQRSGLAVEVVAEESAGELPEEQATCIYRVAQEALQNSVRHAAASKVRIGLQKSEHRVALQVEDDGKGFAAGRMRGLGLLGMEERVSRLGGHLRVQSEPSHGTRVMAELPL